MSKINVDTWEPESGTAATLMASGDTVTLPSGAILSVASGGDINVASGGDINVASGGNINVASSGEIDIASGATLDVNGTIDLTGATTTGFPAGGLTHASLWAVTGILTGNFDPITDTMAERTNYGQGTLGASMTHSSGVFTFPDTGFWQVTAQFCFRRQAGDGNAGGFIKSTVDDGSNWDHVNACYHNIVDTSKGIYGTVSCSAILDVTNTSNNKVSFQISQDNTGNYTFGSTDDNYTTFTFVRLAAT